MSTPKDPWDDPQARQWLRRTREELVPMIEGSSISIAIVPDGAPDVKIAVELGLMVLLDKPIILAVSPGRKIPSKLVLVADEIVELDLTSTSGQQRMKDAIARVTAKLQAEEQE